MFPKIYAKANLETVAQTKWIGGHFGRRMREDVELVGSPVLLPDLYFDSFSYIL